MARVSRRDAFNSIAKAGVVLAGASQFGSKALAAGRHSDPDYCPPVCFVKGSLIDLRRGATPVEDVQIGDEVRTHRGAWAKVKWIGRMEARKAEDATWAHVQKPVLFRRGSIEDNVPNRDLYVSQEHAMLVNDVLIPAKNLVNGSSIAIVTPKEVTIEYLQIECDAHEAIYAHGAACETLFGLEFRPRFTNYREYDALYGAGPDRRMLAYRPILRCNSLLSRARAVIIALAAAVGFDLGDPVQRARDQLRQRAKLISSPAATNLGSAAGSRAYS